jgi:hypothetical protein
MIDALRLRLLEREIELMCHFALIVAEDLEEAADTDSEEQWILIQALIATSLKISHLLWPFGRRATDQISVDEAGAIRARIALHPAFPLVPANIAPLVPCLTLPREQLLQAFERGTRTITLNGDVQPVAPIVTAIAEVKAAVTGGA